MSQLDSYKKLVKIFKDHGFNLFLVGGTVRDFLLKINLTDLDLVTNAKPSDMHKFLDNADFSFEKYGSVKLNFENFKFDITTLRKEYSYDDSRHPSKIEFVNNLEEDVVRRDFTCNGLYMDENLNVFDYVGGQKDIENHVLKMIGNPDARIKEDPLRIIRAIRFSLTYNLNIENELFNAIKNNISELNRLNPLKIKEDINKIKNVSNEEIYNLFNKLGIKNILDVVKW